MDSAPERPSRKALGMLAVLYVSGFIAAFNENIMNVALLDIMATFSVDSIAAQWTVTGYMIVGANIVAISAFLMRRFPLRKLFLTASGCFAGGLVISLLAPTFPVLLASRIIQAFGTGLFVTMLMSTILVVVPYSHFGRYFAIASCCITMGPALGPVVSGIMVSLFGWRAIFVPPLVIILVAMVAAAFLLYNPTETAKARVDGISLLLSVSGLVALTYGLTQILIAPVVAAPCIAAGAGIIALFIRRQGRLEEPILNMRPFKNRRFAVSAFLIAVCMIVSFSMSVLMPLYYQGALGVSAWLSGLCVLIPIIFNAVTALIAGPIMDKRGEWPLFAVGFGLVSLGEVVVFLLAGHMVMAGVVAAAAAVYAGLGLVYAQCQTSGVRTLPKEVGSDGVAIMNVLVQTSACVGPSLFVGILEAIQNRLAAAGAAAGPALAGGFAASVGVAAAIAIAGTIVAIIYAWRVHKIDAAK